MIKKMFLTSALTALAALVMPAPLHAQPTPITPKHTADMAWWKKARFGMFIHWGLYSEAAGTWKGRRIGGIGEWIMNNAHITRQAYATLAKKFDPVDFNADQWVKMAKNAGVKYIVITTKHHDGFCMFRTKATKYNVVDDTPWHKDPMKLLAAACKKYGVRFCTYYSVEDWHSRYTLPNHVAGGKPYWQAMRFVPGGGKLYVKYMQRQVGELIHQYHPGLIWFDNPGAQAWTTAAGQHVPGWTRGDAAAVFHFVRKLDPTVIVNNRLGYDFGDYGTPEQNIPAGGLRGNWETCMTINNTWGYKSYDHDFKSPRTLITNLIKCASGGGNYLLNVGPTGQGIIPQPEVARMLAIGKWLKINGSAIYGTRRTPFKTRLPFGYATRKAGKLFLEVTHWPSDHKLLVPMTNNITKAWLLASPSTVLATRTVGRSQIITLPAKAPDPIATVVVLQTKGPIVTHAPAIHQAANGTLTLGTNTADIHGGQQVETRGGVRDIGFWTNPRDRVSWLVNVGRPGAFVVRLTYAAPSKATYLLTCGSATLHGVIRPTGAWNKFKTVIAGKITINKAGRKTVWLSPQSMPGGALMNLHSIQIVPALSR